MKVLKSFGGWVGCEGRGGRGKVDGGVARSGGCGKVSPGFAGEWMEGRRVWEKEKFAENLVGDRSIIFLMKAMKTSC